MFKQGNILRSKSRTAQRPLFLMVLFELRPNPHQFKAVILSDASYKDTQSGDAAPGRIANNWNKPHFVQSSMLEISEFIQGQLPKMAVLTEEPWKVIRKVK